MRRFLMLVTLMALILGGSGRGWAAARNAMSRDCERLCAIAISDEAPFPPCPQHSRLGKANPIANPFGTSTGQGLFAPLDRAPKTEPKPWPDAVLEPTPRALAAVSCCGHPVVHALAGASPGSSGHTLVLRI